MSIYILQKIKEQVQRLSPNPGFEPMQSSFRAVAPGRSALPGCPTGGKTEGRAGSSSLSLLLDFPLSHLHAVLDHHNKFLIQLGSVSDKIACYTAITF